MRDGGKTRQDDEGTRPSTASSALPVGKATRTRRHTAKTGAALPTQLRGGLESALDTDLASVRVHADDASADDADAIGAAAFAQGDDIHFGAGAYQPGTDAGDFLIAHEVAHTVQQRGVASAPQHKLVTSQSHDAHEQVEPLAHRQRGAARTVDVGVFQDGRVEGLDDRGRAADAGRGVVVAGGAARVGSSRVDLQACKLEYSIVSPK